MNNQMLKGKLREKDITYEEASKQLDVTIATFSNKINGISAFTVLEARKLRKILNLSDSECISIFLE